MASLSGRFSLTKPEYRDDLFTARLRHRIHQTVDVTTAENFALRGACSNGFTNIVKLLIQHGADPAFIFDEYKPRVFGTCDEALEPISPNDPPKWCQTAIDYYAANTDDNITDILRHADEWFKPYYLKTITHGL